MHSMAGKMGSHWTSSHLAGRYVSWVLPAHSHPYTRMWRYSLGWCRGHGQSH